MKKIEKIKYHRDTTYQEMAQKLDELVDAVNEMAEKVEHPLIELKQTQEPERKVGEFWLSGKICGGEKPAKKECLCGGIAGPKHTCYPDKKEPPFKDALRGFTHCPHCGKPAEEWKPEHRPKAYWDKIKNEWVER